MIERTERKWYWVAIEQFRKAPMLAPLRRVDKALAARMPNLADQREYWRKGVSSQRKDWHA
jgi:hypothetical protein